MGPFTPNRLSNLPNGLDAPVNTTYATARATSFTLVGGAAGAAGALGDNGKINLVTQSGLTATLPLIATAGQGQAFTFIVVGDAFAFNISPASTDAITWNGASVDNADVYLNASEMQRNNRITIRSSTSDAWTVSFADGPWRTATV